MKFKSIFPALNEIARLLAETGLFETVRVISATGWQNLLQILPDLTRYPVAVVVPGGITYADGGCTRLVEVAIIIGDRFVSDSAIADPVSDLAVEALTGLNPEDPPCYFGGQLQITNVIPIDLDGGHLWWQVTGTLYQVVTEE